MQRGSRVVVPQTKPCSRPYTQSELGGGGSGAAGQQLHRFIKPEHLSSVISASHGDFLIVIGDRNMKNDSCQVCGADKVWGMGVSCR